MYNKLFTKILDSSIWLESTSTRLVWLTMIAAMDETGFTQFASIPNLAHRARVSLEEAAAAVECLEATDPNSSDPDNEGRRIEKVPGGWMVLNAGKYRDLVTRTVIREQTRLRVAKYRAEKPCNAPVTPPVLRVTNVTPSETDTEAETDTPTTKTPHASADAELEGFRIRVGKLLKRRPSTKWEKDDLKLLKGLGKVEEEDMVALETFYAAIIPPDEKDWRRTSIRTLLKYFSGEIDKARKYIADHAASAHISTSPHNALSLNRTAASSYRQIGEKLRLGLAGNGAGEPPGASGAAQPAS